MLAKDENKDLRDRPLDRYVAILEALAPFPEGLSASDVEAILQLPKTTVNRLLKTLLEVNLVAISSTKARNYVLGNRLLRLTHSAADSSWVVTATQKILQNLADNTGQTCFITKLTGLEIRSVNTESPDTPVRTYVVPGKTMPPNATASGKAILAFQPDDVVQKALGGALEKYTSDTKTDYNLLRAELDEVRKRGYSLDLAEHVDGLASIAAPIKASGIGVIYAVGITGPYDRIVGEEVFKSNLDNLLEAARRLERAIQPIAHSG